MTPGAASVRALSRLRAMEKTLGNGGPVSGAGPFGGGRGAKTAPILAPKRPDGKKAAAEPPETARTGTGIRGESVCAPGIKIPGLGPLCAINRRHQRGHSQRAPPYRGAQKKRRARIFPIHTRTPERIPQKITVSPLYKDRQRKYNDSCKARFQPLRMEAVSPYAGGGVVVHPVPALHFLCALP